MLEITKINLQIGLVCILGFELHSYFRLEGVQAWSLLVKIGLRQWTSVFWEIGTGLSMSLDRFNIMLILSPKNS